MGNFKRNISLTGTIKFTGLELSAPSQTAAGLNGVTAALNHSFKEMGVLRSMKALAKMNQEDGFRCSSCAWAGAQKTPQKLLNIVRMVQKPWLMKQPGNMWMPSFFLKFRLKNYPY